MKKRKSLYNTKNYSLTSFYMKWIFAVFLFLLPFHALFVTFLQCKLWVDTTVIRFWKEIFVVFFLLFTIFNVLKKNKWSFVKIYKNNTLLGLTTLFILSSLLYIFFPYFSIKAASLLGFKYDVFFFFCLLIGFYTSWVKDNIPFLMKSMFISIGIILIIFFPWYLSGNISATTELFGYSDKVSFYEANQCLSFSQNVSGHHRFQATFGGPIRFSVFLVVWYIIYLSFLLGERLKNKVLFFSLSPSIFIFWSIFFSYSKTSFLGIIFALILFFFLANKFIYKKRFSKKITRGIWSIIILLWGIILFVKRELFLHLDAVINRLDNLSKSIEMFFYNPLGYGLGIAGPASQIGTSIESAGGWEISTASPSSINKFLPENWFVQILLEQGIIGLSLFVWLLYFIGYLLFQIVKKEETFLSIGLFVAFITLIFMGFFTHSFEESATSYSLFLLLWAFLWKYFYSKN